MSNISSVTELDISSFTPYGYLNSDHIIGIKEKITTLVKTIISLYQIIDSENISDDYRIRVDAFNREVVHYIELFTSNPKINQTSLENSRERILEEFYKYYQNNWGSKAINDNKSLLHLSVFIKYFIVQHDFTNNSNNLNLKNNKIASNNTLNQIIDNAKKSSEILSELQKKISEQPVSDYAIVFEKESSINNIFAKRWLYCGISISITFVLSIILFSAFGWFEIVVRDVEGKLLYYNFSNLFTKVVLVAIQVFFISFSFKQFNVNKHLETLNKHRQNALNSYKLFQQSIIGNDNGSHNALMIQVAKSIYEHPQSTGFLNENGQQMNSGIVELTKIISDNKTN